MSDVYQKFEVGLMLTEASECIPIANVILCVDEKDLGSAESLSAFQDAIKSNVYDGIVIKPVGFTESDNRNMESITYDRDV